MEAIVVFGLLLVVAVMSALFGYDSRAGLRSKEEDLASLGVVWTHANVPAGPTSAGAARHWHIGQGLSSATRIFGLAASFATSLLK